MSDPSHKLTREELDACGAAVHRLPPLERSVMGLYYFDGLSYVDIGQVLDLETEAVERLHATAIRRVRTMLGR